MELEFISAKELLESGERDPKRYYIVIDELIDLALQIKQHQIR